MREVGVDPDGPEARLLYAWATTSDETDETLADALASVLAGNDDNRSMILESVGDASAIPAPYLAAQVSSAVSLGTVQDLADSLATGIEDRIRDVLGKLTTLLISSGLIPDLPDPAPRLGYSVLSIDGAASVHRVDLAAADFASREAAEAVADGRADGPISYAERAPWGPGGRPRHVALRAEFGPKWDRGEYGRLGDLDTAIMERLRCTERHARRIRASWGIGR